MLAYWWLFGSFWLGWMLFVDLTKRDFDDKRNWFMSGLSISLISHVRVVFWYFVCLALVIVVLHLLLDRFDIAPKNELVSVSWVMVGFGILGWVYLMWWFFLVLVLSLVFLLLKQKLFKYKVRGSFYPVIFLSFVCNIFLTGVVWL